MRLSVRYFAEMKEQAGCDSQQLRYDRAPDARALYEELRQRHAFRFAPEVLRVAVNGRFVSWEQGLAEGDEVAFLPPFSGG